MYQKHHGCGCWQRQHGWSNVQHEVRCGSSRGRSTVQKGFDVGTTRGSPWSIYHYTIWVLKWANIDFKQLVYLMNGTYLRVALIWYPGKLQPMHRRKHIVSSSHPMLDKSWKWSWTLTLLHPSCLSFQTVTISVSSDGIWICSIGCEQLTTKKSSSNQVIK